MEKKQEDKLKVSKTKQGGEISGNLRVVAFKDGDFFISYLPSLNLTGYGDTEEEASKMLLEVVLKDYFENLMVLSEQKLMEELRSYGWERKPFLTKQLRNIQFLDTNAIKDNFNLPSETVINEKYVTA